MKTIKKTHILKSSLFLLMVSAFMFYLISSAFAQEVENRQVQLQQTRENIEERRAELKEQRKENIEERQGVVAERKVALKKRVQDRITNLSNNIKNKMTAANNRLEQIIDRLETRIAKLNALGVDTTSTLILVDKAKYAIDSAKTSLNEIDILIEKSVTSDNPRKDFSEVRSKFKAAHNYIKLAHNYLRQAIATLKNAIREAEIGNGVSDAVVDKNNIKACTQEAKICDDGSAVGRSGPSCEFAKCPSETE